MPIQCQAIPAIMSGRDMIGIAKTFLLSMFRHILDQSPLADDYGPIALIMTLTRELCMQIGKDSKRSTKSLGLSQVFTEVAAIPNRLRNLKEARRLSYALSVG